MSHTIRIFLLALIFTLPAAQATELKDWTMLVFINGHNDLDSFGTSNIKQMERVGSTDKVNVVVQWASLRAPDTKRLYITKSTNPNQVTSPVVESLPPVNMGKAESLVEFVRWAKERYPARHYFIDVWNHGTGWHGAISRGELKPSDISRDERFKSQITTKQLGAALSTIRAELGQKVDIYGSDACLMGMAEVAGEMKDAVDVFVGAEEVEPLDGWPYDQLLREWNKLEYAKAEDVGQILVREYIKAYSGGQFGSNEVTLSALRLSGWAELEESVRNLATELQNVSAAERATVVKAATKTQTFSSPDYKDLAHFTETLGSSSVAGVTVGSLSAVRAAVKNVVIENGVTEEFKNAHGLAIWLPERRSELDSHEKKYSELEFARTTGWGTALSRIHSK